MDWFRAVDGYCERVGEAYLAEPINAVTNLGFLLVAFWMWPRVRGIVGARVLCAILGMIGLGSYLFHTHAQVWAGVVDVAPIAVFVLTYIWLANVAYLRLPVPWAALGVLMFVPYAALVIWSVGRLPIVGSSAAYVAVALLIAIYAVVLRRRLPEVARGLGIGAAILFVSITFRSIDAPLCNLLPMGTHFVWHLLNAVMLGWMIEVYRRHMVAGAGTER